jgi:hypothetical protein
VSRFGLEKKIGWWDRVTDFPWLDDMARDVRACSLLAAATDAAASCFVRLIGCCLQPVWCWGLMLSVLRQSLF